MKKLSVDFGSGVTKIYMPGSGVVLMEATCVAVEKSEDGVNVKAYGDKARSLYGRAAKDTQIVYPVREGDILNEELAAELLAYFLEKIELPVKRAKRAEVIFILPCGISPEVREKYQRLALSCGFVSVYFTLTPFAAVLGHNVSVGESTPVFSLDIGYSLANIAAFSQDGIISGLSVNVGGGSIDGSLIEELAANSDLKIGALTAERLKNTVGSLLEDDNKMMVIDGRNLLSGAPSSVAVNSGRIYPVITKYIDKILQYVNLVLSKLPAEVASAVMHGGIYLSGGLLKLDGLAEYISKQLNIPVNMHEEPQLAAVIGGGTILANDELSDKFVTV